MGGDPHKARRLKGPGMSNLLDAYTDRQYAALILYDGHTSGCNIDAQFDAIRGLFASLEQAETSAAEKLSEQQKKVSESTGPARDHADDCLNDSYHSLVYEDAARSMAAISMLAPFIEMLFTRLFSCSTRQKKYYNISNKHHVRWKLKQQLQWNCNWWAKPNENKERDIDKGIAKGIMQICDAIELTKHLPKDIRILLDVIFEYRNKMFHNGFEWPKAERSKFLQEIQKSNCPNTWFNNATWGNDPWVCYLSQDFINRCIDAIEEILDGIGAYDRWADAQK